MTQIFNFIGNVFGYIMWLFYSLTQNYGLALILFTIALKVILFPLSIKQQKSMAANARMAAKQRELQKLYGNDKQKLSEETAKLYEKEGVNPMGGCLTSFLPLFLMLGVYYVVINPLQNVLHIAVSKVNEATAMLQQIPGIGGNFSYYGEIEIVKNFGHFQDYLTMFDSADLSKIGFFSHGFQFFGLDLLRTPKGSGFMDFLWLIPVLCLLSSWVTAFLQQKITGNQMQGAGCMKWMLFLMPLVSAWFAYTVPAAVGLYWIVSTVVTFLQTLVLNHFYNADIMMAKSEAQRIALREIEEANVRRIGVSRARKLAIEGPAEQRRSEPAKKRPQQNGKKKNKGKGGDYLGESKTRGPRQ
jgi:YidC/Oxa1 family membrane protein insertase